MAITLDGTNGITSSGDLTLNNGNADGAQVKLSSSGYSDWNLDNYSGRFRAYYNATERFTIDTSGNVGIGTSSPLSLVDLGSAYVTPATNTAADVKLSVTTISSTEKYGFFVDNTASLVSLSGSNSGGGRFRWVSGSTERMRIDTSGNVLVNTATGTGSKFDVTQTVDSALTCAFFDARQATATNQYGFVTRLNGDPNNTTNYFMNCFGGANSRFVARSNGGLANYSANNANLSDERLKTDITPAKSYLDTICSIPVVTFKYKDQTDEELNLGVIAQSVDAVAPELVDHSGFGEAPEGENPYLAVYQTDLQYALMKCIQEQQELIKSLTSRIETLEAK